MDKRYDFIGDIHGYAQKLENLLKQLGYQNIKGAWRHPERTAVFLGDFLDRGPEQIRTYKMVRQMIDAGSAYAVMGNHEFNAIAFHTMDDNGQPLRKHSEKNLDQHKHFLREVGMNSHMHDEIIAWAMTLPLWLDLKDVRAVHACWHDEEIGYLESITGKKPGLTRDILLKAARGSQNAFNAHGMRENNVREFQAIETILKGVEVSLPEGCYYKDAEGHERTNARVKWWEPQANTYRKCALVPGSDKQYIPDHPVPDNVLHGYEHPKPLFIGHYWMSNKPEILAPQLACVDYSAGKGGPLAAYCWSGEQTLKNEHFITAM
jgi:hypothetical protein